MRVEDRPPHAQRRLVLGTPAPGTPSRARSPSARCRAPTGASGRGRRARCRRASRRRGSFVPSVALLKICSFARGVRKQRERVHDRQHARRAPARRPGETMSCSAIPHSTKRSGKRSRNAIRPVSRTRSASSATSRVARARRRRRAPRRRRRRAAAARPGGAGRVGASSISSSSGSRPSRSRRRSTQLAERRVVLARRRRAGVVGVERRAAARAASCGSKKRDARALDRVGDEQLRAVRLALEQARRASPRARPMSLPSQRAVAQPNAADLRLEVAEVATRGRPRCRTGSCCGRRSP